MKELFNNLMTLTETTEAFYFKDFVYDADGYTYRIFNYRLAGWQQFHELPDALECRGIMFREMPNEIWELVSRPMEKFFNAHEGAVDHDWENPEVIMTKEDGSLISTFIDANGNLGVKSKGSLYSDQANAARGYLENNPEFSNDLRIRASLGNTINMEWVGPSNRIVLSYPEHELRILNIRNNTTGEYLSGMIISVELSSQWVQEYPEPEDMNTFVNSIPDMKGIEGFIIRKANGVHVKLKTDEYITLHKSKDSISNPKSLYMVAVEDATDDLKELFLDDPVTIQLIEKMEKVVAERYNHAAATVENYYETHKHLERKDYAIAGQKTLEPWVFSIAMRRYLDDDDSYLKKAVQKQWKSWKDEITDTVYGVDYCYEEE